jgi:hypothetical protein
MAGETQVAGTEDEAEIRALLRRSVIDGQIRLAFTREPSYQAGEGIAGSIDTTAVARHDGRVCAMGRCSVQPLMRNGARTLVGYLGELRTDADTPGAPRMLRHGYHLLAEQAIHDGAEGFVTAIARDNVRARQVLEHGGRMGLPRYRPLADLVTLLIPASRAAAREAAPPPANRHAADELAAWFAAQAAHTHLALAWGPDTWSTLAKHHVTVDDACVATDGRRILAAAIVWDARAFRQTRVMGYRRTLAVARPMLNALAGLTGMPTFPQPGGVLAQGTLLAASVTSPTAWHALLPLVRARAAAKGLDMVALTLDERDPAVRLIESLVRTRAYRTTLYEVTFAGHPGFAEPWNAQYFRPEAGLL